MRRSLLPALAIAFVSGASHAAIIGGCRFDTATHQFQGTTLEQANCLLRAVRKKGAGSTPQAMPAWIQENVGKPVGLDVEQVTRYLGSRSIDVVAIGGPLQLGSAPDIRYFVIHDTSSPEIPEKDGFPTNINEPSYRGNNLAIWSGSFAQKVNLIISRDGQSRAYRRWGEIRTSPAMKLEMQRYSAASRKHFVHVENVQPRLKPQNTFAWIAPNPGFAPKQEERLALAYIAASVQAGRWLVPAYHFNIDQGIPDGHDDPQNMDLASWVRLIAAMEIAIKR